MTGISTLYTISNQQSGKKYKFGSQNFGYQIWFGTKLIMAADNLGAESI